MSVIIIIIIILIDFLNFQIIEIRVQKVKEGWSVLGTNYGNCIGNSPITIHLIFITFLFYFI